jgi:hypothetical protein
MSCASGNRCLDQVRRRVQHETLVHRGRKQDPLYRIRKLWLTGNERLDATGQSRMLLGLRVGEADDAPTLLDKAIVACVADDVPEIRTLARWRNEILNHHLTGASNGPTEALNLAIKKVKRAGHGFRRFDHYRLRCLLHAGGVTWPNRPSPPRIRTRRAPLG